MCQEPVAGREAAALEYIIDYQEDRHDNHHRVYEVRTGWIAGDQGAELVRPAESKIENNASTESDDKVAPGIDLVSDYSVQQF